MNKSIKSKKIITKCLHCNSIFLLDKTPELPANVAEIEVNWCPNCQDDATEAYNETYIYETKKTKLKNVCKAQIKIKF